MAYFIYRQMHFLLFHIVFDFEIPDHMHILSKVVLSRQMASLYSEMILVRLTWPREGCSTSTD
ncbi:protein of unknown function [Paenibacillus alvei]|uniref:Uncharacterized protein n=1 Tax=Paenibacillus alvei TaxID=44250 RepID=A0A383RKP3_PAEAL|nr:protein of unknown function [Paenibacillus alvei]